MVGMDIVWVVVLVALAAAAAALAAVEVTRRRFDATSPVDVPPSPPVEDVVAEAVATALTEMRAQTATERDAAVRAALEQAAVLQREQLGAAARQAHERTSTELTAKKDVIDARLDQVHAEMRSELTKLETGRD